MQVFSHSMADAKLLPFAEHPPQVKSSQRPLSRLKKNRGTSASQGPTFFGWLQRPDSGQAPWHAARVA